jgi:SAM-dependent methyltransferase
MMDSKYPGLAIQPDMGRRAGPMVRLLRPLLRAQFGQPSGVVGQIVGQILAHAKSNTERTLWTLSLLDIRPGDRMLEIGCGPGVALEIASQMASTGIVVGVDHSEVMVRQAASEMRAPSATDGFRCISHLLNNYHRSTNRSTRSSRSTPSIFGRILSNRFDVSAGCSRHPECSR